MNSQITPNPWQSLRQYTPARIAQGRAGHSLPTSELLKFQEDHALARDAVYSVLAKENLEKNLQNIDFLEIIIVESQAKDRQEYLKRPDFGRKLSLFSHQKLQSFSTKCYDLAIVIADGLSATAVNRHVVPLLTLLIPALAKEGWSLAPISLVMQGRVAIADEIGELLQAENVVILLGERPGLSSPDSLGAYLTHAPKVGLTDESRNCVSNIHPEGLDYQAAARKILYLLTEMKSRKISGVNLKDNLLSEELEIER